MFSSPSNQRPTGFSLIEAVVAIAILLVGIFAVIRLFPLGLAVTSEAQRLTTATNFAQAELELLQQTPYDQLAVGTVEAKGQISSDPADLGYHYQRETTVSYTDSTLTESQTDTGFKKITVTVYWTSAVTRAEKSISLHSLVAFY